MAEPGRSLKDGRAPRDDRGVWEAVWARSRDMPARDYLSQRLSEEISSVVGEMGGRRVMEAGSGSGRICARLHAAGARVYLLDRSRTALSLARRVVPGPRAHFLCGDVSGLPFRQECFDVVFSSGVMEHWTEGEQRRFLGEVARVVRTGGVFLAFNPYSRSFLYRFGKAMLEASGLWPYGDEHPVSGLGGAMPGEWQLAGEHSTGFLALLVNAFRLVPGLRRLDGPVQAVAVGALDTRVLGRLVRGLDRALSRLLGGYLLVSVMVRR